MSPRRAHVLAVCVALLSSAAGCSLGQGDGQVRSDSLYAPDCWLYEEYDLQPDFFAAVPYRNTLQIRVQRDSDLQEVSDGLAVLVDDVEQIRSELLGQPICVTLPPGVTPPGAPPVGPDPILDPLCEGRQLVHVALYLQASCHNQNTVLYAVRGLMQFDALFSGDPNEVVGEEKYTNVSEFTLWMGDPRDAPPGAAATDIPEDKLSKVTGYFSFYFERGQPGQPFP